MRDLSGAPFGLPPFAGRDRVPCWAIRAGSIPELEPARPGLPLWMAIYSVNLGRADPCYCQEATLAATAGIARRTCRRRLWTLRQVPGLLLEIPRGRDRRTGRFRSTVRWATDPLNIWAQSPRIQKRLEEVAELLGHDRAWFKRACVIAWAHDGAARKLARSLNRSVAPTSKPAARSAQYGVGSGGQVTLLPTRAARNGATLGGKN